MFNAVYNGEGGREGAGFEKRRRNRAAGLKLLEPGKDGFLKGFLNHQD